jgi:hypothetical protein
MKSEKIDINHFIKQIIDEFGFGEATLFQLLAEAYGAAFKTEVKAIPLSTGENEIKYVLVDISQDKVLNNLKLTGPKLAKITDLFKTKCTEISNKLEIARRMKTLKGTGPYTTGVFESRFGEYNLYFIQNLGLYAKIKTSEFDIMVPDQRDKKNIQLKLISISVKNKTGKVEVNFLYKDKQNIKNILMPYFSNMPFTVADFIGNRVKVRVKSKPTTDFMKNIIKQTGINIQFVWPKSGVAN